MWVKLYIYCTYPTFYTELGDNIVMYSMYVGKVGYTYTVKNCCKIYSNLLAILVASKTVNLQKFCKSIITIVL